MWGCGESDGDDEGGTVAGEETEEGEEIGADGQRMETMATCKQVDDEEVIEEKKSQRGTFWSEKSKKEKKKMEENVKSEKENEGINEGLGRKIRARENNIQSR